LKMHIKVSTRDKNVIKIYHNKTANEREEIPVHHPHKSTWGIRQPEWHHQPLI